MPDQTCHRCGAPHGKTVYRRQFDSTRWTMDSLEAQMDHRYDQRPRLVQLGDDGLCQHCGKKVKP